MYKFSIVIPSYNIKNFSKEFFKTMNYISDKVDVIFVNDFSTDNTQELIEKFIKGKPNMRLFNHERNLGPGGAVNTGIENMRTNWYFRIDPDDILHENYEQRITEEIEKTPNAKLIRYKFLFNTPDGIKQPNIFETMYFKMAFGWSCGFNIEKFGKPKYKANFKMEDMEMFARQYKKTKDPEIFIDDFLVSYTTQRKNSTMNSINSETLANWKHAFKIYKKNKSIKGFRQLLYKMNIRKRIWKYNKVHKRRPAFLKILIHILIKFFIKTKKHIVFMAYNENTDGYNERVIFDEMYKRYSKKYKFTWLANEVSTPLPKGVKVYNTNSIGAIKSVSSASHFISGTFTKFPNLKKKTKVYYLNHGYSVKTMGIDWVNEASGIEKIIRRMMHKNQVKQIDKCFSYDEYDMEHLKRIFNHKGKKTLFIQNGFPSMKKYETGDDILFLPSWHEKAEIVFPKLNMKNKYVSFHPRTKNNFPPSDWEKIKGKDREKLKLKYVFSDNSAAPLEYIKSGIQAYWIKGEYDRDFCQEFKDKYAKLIIDPKNFKPLSKKEYDEIVEDILDAPSNEESIKITVDVMKID